MMGPSFVLFWFVYVKNILSTYQYVHVRTRVKTSSNNEYVENNDHV